MTEVPLRVLLVEDNPDDALLVIRQLKQGGYDPTSKQVCTARHLTEALEQASWDIILSDYSMGQFTGLDALHIMQEKQLDLPFIVVSGTIGEDVAVLTMKSGAHDYLMKDNLARLVPAVRRELAEAKSRELRRQAERDKKLLLNVLEQQNKELKNIVYISSHDLRTPLVTIHGFSGELKMACSRLTELLSRDYPEVSAQNEIKSLLHESIPEALNFISANVTKMGQLVDSLLQICRIGSLSLKIEPVDMNYLMSRVLESMTYQIRKYGIIIQCRTLPGCIGDMVMIDQVFTNLIDNAIKYRHPDRPLTIEVSASADAKTCTYFVKDNGIGIKKEYHDKIFEIFHRLNPNDNRGGLGLGLAIIRSILNRINGSIAVQSEPGEGSTFTVTLPRT